MGAVSGLCDYFTEENDGHKENSISTSEMLSLSVLSGLT